MLGESRTASTRREQAGEAADNATRQSRRSRARSLCLLAATLLLSLGVAAVPLDLALLGAYGYAGVFLLALLSSATVVLPTPALGVAVIAGKTLNPWLSGLLMGLGAGLGEVTGFLAGRAGSELASRSQLYPAIVQRVERYGMLTIFILAAIPSPLLDLAGIAAGALRMPFWRFQLACTAGKVARYLAVARLGYYLAQKGWL